RHRHLDAGHRRRRARRGEPLGGSMGGDRLMAVVTRALVVLFGIVAYTFILAPIAIILPASLADGAAFVFPPQGLTGEWYARLIRDGQLLGSLLLSFGVGLL